VLVLVKDWKEIKIEIKLNTINDKQVIYFNMCNVRFYYFVK
jgi:hypothetical protein